MKHPITSYITLPILCLTLLAQPSPVQAVPPLPSSIYGIVKVNDENVPDGTLVEALIEGQVMAYTLTQTYQGDSVYALDVPGDDGTTTQKEGGVEGDVITFKIGGVAANEIGSWHSATNVSINLTGTSTAKLDTPQPTPIPINTQTPITVIYVTDLPTSTFAETLLTNLTPTSPGKTIQPTAIIETPAFSSSSPRVTMTAFTVEKGLTSERSGFDLSNGLVFISTAVLAALLLSFGILRIKNKKE